MFKCKRCVCVCVCVCVCLDKCSSVRDVCVCMCVCVCVLTSVQVSEMFKSCISSVVDETRMYLV